MIEHLNLNEIGLINQTITDLYNDEIDPPARLLNFYQSVSSLVYFDRVTLFFFYLDESNNFHKHSSVAMNWEERQESVKQYDDYYCNYDDTLPVIMKNNKIIFRSHDFFNIDKRKETVFWKGYLEPNDCIYSLEGALKLNNTIGLHGGFAFYRSGSRSDFTEKDEYIMQLFQPHLSNILKYYGQPGRAETGKKFSMLFNDYDSIGLAMYNENLQLLQKSDAFSRIINKYPDHNIHGKVTDLLANFTNNKNEKSIRSYNYKFHDLPVFIEVNRLRELSDTTPTRYGCLLYDLSIISDQTIKQLKDEYNLTDTEYQVLKALLEGCSNEDICAKLFMSLPTVKRHLTTIYSKLGVNNYKQLFQKLNLTSIPTR